MTPAPQSLHNYKSAAASSGCLFVAQFFDAVGLANLELGTNRDIYLTGDLGFHGYQEVL